jgi:pimeloyl-ACP methyl ester carboxylesterase
LGDHHTYEFVEGTISTGVAPELQGSVSSTDEFFAYADFTDQSSCLDALNHFDRYIAAEGPFDGVLAFSQGAALALAYLAQRWTQDPVGERLTPVIKCAVFFSPRNAYDAALQRVADITAATRLSPADITGVICIPTAHIWGRNDSDTDASSVIGLCSSAGRETYIHHGAHEIPGARTNAAVKACVQAIRRVISTAQEAVVTM